MDEEEGVICHYSALSADKEAMAAKTLLCCCCVCVRGFLAQALGGRSFSSGPCVLPACFQGPARLGPLIASHCSWSGLHMARLEALALGSEEGLTRPCVDCGLVTGCYCDHCRAADRLPQEVWGDNQMTPLCSQCERKHGACHFCRRQHWCTPPQHTQASRTTS